MSLSDFESDLTELSSSEEEYIPTPRKKRASRVKDDYKIQNALRPPRTTQYSAKSLYDQMIDERIDLNPEYQRDVVWPESKQSGLIDSILRNYYIPPVIFAVTAEDDGTERRTCIDGKQRLTSIQMFMDGLICHKDSVTSKRYWYKDGPGPKRTLLPRQYMQAFANKQITCVEYDCLTDDQEREIFQRVQLGVALTPAERMQANTGPRSALIREIQSQILGEEGFGDSLDWGHARGRDFQCLASIIYLIDQQPNGRAAFPGAAQLDKWLSPTATVSPKFRAEVLDTFRIFVALVRNKRYNAAFQKPTRVSPIEFTMTGLLIYIHRANLSMTQLSSAIFKMRADVRGKHADIRANGRVTKTMFTFIKKGLKAEVLKDAKDEPVAANSVSQRSETQKKVQKRKRGDSSSDEDSDGDFQPAPKASRTTYAKAQETTKTKQALSKKPTSKSATTKSSQSTMVSIKPPPLPGRSTINSLLARQPLSMPEKPVKQRAPKAPPVIHQAADMPPPSRPASATPPVPALPRRSPASAARKSSLTGRLGDLTINSPVIPTASLNEMSIDSPMAPASPVAPASPSVPAAPVISAALPVSTTPLTVKTEPESDTARLPQLSSSASTPTRSILKGSVDRLAALRAAKLAASSDATSSTRASASPHSGSGSTTPQSGSLILTQPTANGTQPPRDILDNAPPLLKREQQPPSIPPAAPGVNGTVNGHHPSPAATSSSAGQPPVPGNQSVSMPAGQQIHQADIEKVLAQFGYGRPAQPTPPPPPPSQPEHQQPAPPHDPHAMDWAPSPSIPPVGPNGQSPVLNPAAPAAPVQQHANGLGVSAPSPAPIHTPAPPADVSQSPQMPPAPAPHRTPNGTHLANGHLANGHPAPAPTPPPSIALPAPPQQTPPPLPPLPPPAAPLQRTAHAGSASTSSLDSDAGRARSRERERERGRGRAASRERDWERSREYTRARGYPHEYTKDEWRDWRRHSVGEGQRGRDEWASRRGRGYSREEWARTRW